MNDSRIHQDMKIDQNDSAVNLERFPIYFVFSKIAHFWIN